VPIFDRQSEVLCGISMGGLTPQMSDRGRPIHLERPRAAAEAIEARL
jgi:IclR family transcriptional regulator, KDG regulon repressor